MHTDPNYLKNRKEIKVTESMAEELFKKVGQMEKEL